MSDIYHGVFLSSMLTILPGPVILNFYRRPAPFPPPTPIWVVYNLSQQLTNSPVSQLRAQMLVSGWPEALWAAGGLSPTGTYHTSGAHLAIGQARVLQASPQASSCCVWAC